MFEVFKAIMQRQISRRDPSASLWASPLPLSSSIALAVAGGTADMIGAVNMANQRNTLRIATPGNGDQGDTLFPTTPRLRLPQKMTKPHSKALSGPSTPAQAYPTDIPDIPTRPMLPPLHIPPHTSQPVVPTPQHTAHPHQMLQVGVGWDAGLLRRHEPNEDSVITLQGMCSYQGQLVPFGLFCIADGMGGHEDGKEASRIAIERMMQTVLQNILMGHELSEEFLTDMLVGGVEWANLAIYHHAQSLRKDMGTTLTAALVVGTKAYIVNVGDSRTYLYREGEELFQITRDHSLVATLVEDGEITADEIYTHPDRSKIYRSLGYSETVEVDWFITDLHPQDRLVLCSDGLWEMVRDVSIERILRNYKQPVEASNRLVQVALRAGGADNISVIVVLNA